MDARELFLEQHAAVHSVAGGGNKASAAERVFGVTDEQMRARPREELNSLAWIMWHIARSEDIFVHGVLAGRPQTLDDSWAQRLKTGRRDLGTGMTSAEVTELTRQVDLAALRDYRDVVGRRTRELVATFTDEDWQGQVGPDDLKRAAAQGDLGPRTELLVKAFTGRPRTAVLNGIALFHSAQHIGEAGTVRSAGGFGTGV